MKKMIMIMAAAVIFTAPAMAQKINVESLLSKVEKSDETIANPKKSGKAASWITRGEAFYNLASAPTNGLFANMAENMVAPLCGNPASTGSEEINGTTYKTLVYPYFTAYVANGVVVAWKDTKSIKENALDSAIEAYAKAYELDPKQGSKIKAGLEDIFNHCGLVGKNAEVIADYALGGDAYMTAYKAQSVPAYGEANPGMLYYAGYMYTIEGNENPSIYPKGVEALEGAIAAGYTDLERADESVADKDKGSIFYYLYYCYYGQKDKDAANVAKAKDALVKGITEFPKNQRIIDGLAQLYTSEPSVGDPSELITIIDDVIKGDPTNADMWFARGRVFNSLKKYDDCIASFKEYTKLVPDSYDGQFFLGYFYICKGDGVNDEITKKSYSATAEYDADIKALFGIYADAIPHLEKAHEIKPNDPTAIEYLKSVCFRLRDEPGMMDKYTKYNNLFKEMQANQ